MILDMEPGTKVFHVVGFFFFLSHDSKEDLYFVFSDVTSGLNKEYDDK